MTNMLKRFLVEEQGQDLIEYTLLLAFVCLVAAGLFISAGSTVSNIWAIGNGHLSNAEVAAGS